VTRLKRPRVAAAAALVLLLVVLLSSGGCGGGDVKHGVVYDARYGDATNMDVYLPSDGGSRRPAVLLIHGGGWYIGEKEDFILTAHRLSASGYVAASINYRMKSAGMFPAAVRDGACALAFLRAHADEYGIDPDRIVLFGYSAGAYIANLLGVAIGAPGIEADCAAGLTGPPRAVISGSGPTDLRLFDDAFLVVKFMGGTAAEKPALYDLASTVAHVKPGDPPFLFVQGDADSFVTVKSSLIMRDALLGVGTDARMLKLAGGGHLLNAGDSDPADVAFGLSTDTPEAWIAIADFLERTVGRP
jgi:acetyl esterase/lipase